MVEFNGLTKMYTINETEPDIDNACFSRAKAEECDNTATLTLKMPIRFMADWVRNNYSHVILRLASSCGVKIVELEYGYELLN